MQRRDFLARAALTATGCFLSPRSYAQTLGANDRVRVALVGCGTRGQHVAGLMAKVPGAEFVAACDVYDTNAAAASRRLGLTFEPCRDFRRVLDRKDVDAILVATPDHWHAIPTVLACEAGKDVYVEKPLAHNVAEGRAMVAAARQHNCIVQTGTQHRTAPHYREVQEMVQSNALGDIRFVRVWNYNNRSGSLQRRNRLDRRPSDLDWDFYLGPAPDVPYESSRFLGSFRNYFDYAGGYVADWGTHRFDSVRQMLGESDPLSVSATARWNDTEVPGDTPDVVQATIEFPNFVMSYEGIQTNSHGVGGRSEGMKYYRMSGTTDRPHGVALHGTRGTVIIDRIGFDVYPDEGSLRIVSDGSSLKRQSVQSRDTTDLHVANFIECVRSRKKPAADVEIGHRSTIIPHLINIAARTGEKFHWDTGTERITDSEAASELLSREPREKWALIATS